MRTNCCENMTLASPKDPPVLKSLRRANSARTVKFGMEIRKRYGETARTRLLSQGREAGKRYRESKTTAWRVPNPPGANPLVAERAPWRSSQSCLTQGQQPIGNP